MRLFERTRIVAQLARAGVAWWRRDIDYPSPVVDNPLFMSARDAVRMIRDGDVLADSGLGGNQRSSVIYWAIRDAFERNGHPAGLTVMNLGGHGGRGRMPGTLEELAQPGLCRRLVTGHFETLRGMLALAAAGQCELQCLPQGTMALLLDELGHGRDSLLSDTGIGTFIDPRVGSGSHVGGPAGEPLVQVEHDRLRYRIPRIDVAVFNAPAADRRGNIYMRHCTMTGESAEMARAARRNGGRVIANVGRLVDAGDGDVFLPAEMIDAVVYHPDTEQTSAVFHRDPWLAVTTEADGDVAAALERARLVSRLASVTPKRSSVDAALARLAAATLAEHVGRGAYVNIGTGLPEEVACAVFTAGGLDGVTFMVESGPIGGLPAPGAYFGAAFSPQRIVSSTEMFRLCYEALDATCLGALQVDAQGNVNVSKRGEGPRGYVGPGGFIDLSTAAETVLFVTNWTNHCDIVVEGERLRVRKHGAPKFVEHVDQITFNGPRALAAGKTVLYATPVGLFRLTPRGLHLERVMPGIDVQRDILAVTPVRVVVPTGEIPVVPAAVVTGEGFTVRFNSRHTPRHRRSDNHAAAAHGHRRQAR